MTGLARSSKTFVPSRRLQDRELCGSRFARSLASHGNQRHHLSFVARSRSLLGRSSKSCLFFPRATKICRDQILPPIDARNPCLDRTPAHSSSSSFSPSSSSPFDRLRRSRARTCRHILEHSTISNSTTLSDPTLRISTRRQYRNSLPSPPLLPRRRPSLPPRTILYRRPSSPPSKTSLRFSWASDDPDLPHAATRSPFLLPPPVPSPFLVPRCSPKSWLLRVVSDVVSSSYSSSSSSSLRRHQDVSSGFCDPTSPHARSGRLFRCDGHDFTSVVCYLLAPAFSPPYVLPPATVGPSSLITASKLTLAQNT